MNCEKCGGQIPEGSKICAFCNQVLDDSIFEAKISSINPNADRARRDREKREKEIKKPDRTAERQCSDENCSKADCSGCGSSASCGSGFGLTGSGRSTGYGLFLLGMAVAVILLALFGKIFFGLFF